MGGSIEWSIMALLRQIIPSMFHRRLLLIGLLVMLFIGVVGAQLVKLTAVQGERWLAEAESVMVSHRLLPTVRGSIYDAKGRLLAHDVPRDDVKVHYSIISGRWAYTKARSKAWKDNRHQWEQLSEDQRMRLVAGAEKPFDQIVESLWQTICERGQISREQLEERKYQIIRRVAMVQATVWERQAQQFAQREGVEPDFDDLAVRVSEQDAYHTILADVDVETASYFGKLEKKYEGLRVQPTRRRAYALPVSSVPVDMSRMASPLRQDQPIVVRLDDSASQLIGQMRDVWAEDVDESLGGRPYRRADGSTDLGGYLPGDERGRDGVEYAVESELRGARGRESLRRDTQEMARIEPVRGQDVRLTIDMALQQDIAAMLHPDVGLMKVQPWHRNDDVPVGTPLNGAVVVMEVDSGRVLAMVSSPTAPRPDESENPAGWPGPHDQPHVNRTISAVYPPGSTFKPIIYALAASRGAMDFDEVIDCQGHLLPDRPNLYRCWIYKTYQQTHGPLGPAEAIARSCNIYFYSAGRALGPQRLIEGLHEFGFGQVPGVGLEGEVAGILPQLDEPNTAGRGLTVQNAILMGIGQGPVAVSPMQVAVAHAALARGGVFLSPVLFEHRQSQQISRDLRIPPRVMDNILQGMEDSANAPYGTSHLLSLDGHSEPLLTLEGVVCRSKTGTAQAPIQFDDVNANGQLDDGELVIRSGSHSWYVCHVQRPGELRAAFVIVAMVEYGGSGGRVSGPVVNQVLHLLRKQGYL